jgi:amino-acid N-acetyltransferase
MLPRPISRIYDNIRDYLVFEYNGEVVGCGSLHIIWSDLAEIRSLALKEELAGKGFGRLIVEKLIEEARILEIEKIFVLTYQEEFFKKMGFTVIDKSELPHKIWADCLNCVHFPNCNEIAMMMKL